MIGWAPSFSVLEIVTQKDCSSCFFWVLKVSLRLALIQKGGLCPFRLLPLITEFYVFMFLQGIAPRNSWLGGRFFEGLQNYMESKSEENKNKIRPGDFTCIMDEMERSGTNKILYRYCFNCTLSKLIVDNGLEDLWRRVSPDSSEFTCYDRFFGTTSRIDRVYTDIKIASNIKINNIMVSFTDHCNAIFIDRFPSKTKTGILKCFKMLGTLKIIFYLSLSSP